MKKKSLLKQLTEYNKTRIPMHMPGHKRNVSLLGRKLPYAVDITEVDGFDNLHDMQGVLKETAELAASLYGAKDAFPLVGGSSCGILAAMHALTTSGDHILMARGSHRSVYHGVDLLSLTPHYLVSTPDKYGVLGAILPEQVEEAFLKTPEMKLVIITSPTYEGVVSDIPQIANICHRHGAYLLVDAAHGAHFGFSERFSKNAANMGADVVVMSLHKTLPALTQTALLAVCSDKVDADKIKESLSFFESSSPSYVLLASIDECIRFMNTNGTPKLNRLGAVLNDFYEKAKKLKVLSVVHYDDFSKILISTKNASLSGVALSERLRTEFSIETEMASSDFVLAMATLCDRKKHLKKLLRALFQIDKTLTRTNEKNLSVQIPLPEQKETSHKARTKQGEFVPLSKAAGRMCLEYIFCYPPGIPFVCPGEVISKELLVLLQSHAESHCSLKSTKGKILENLIYVAK